MQTIWSPTGGLFAIAAAIIVAAVNIAPGRYQFLPGTYRGDTVTGHIVACSAVDVNEPQPCPFDIWHRPPAPPADTLLQSLGRSLGLFGSATPAE